MSRCNKNDDDLYVEEYLRCCLIVTNDDDEKNGGGENFSHIYTRCCNLDKYCSKMVF